jgi:hypothetical protein
MTAGILPFAFGSRRLRVAFKTVRDDLVEQPQA